MSVVVVLDELMLSCLLQLAKMGPYGKFSLTQDIRIITYSTVTGKWGLLSAKNSYVLTQKTK